jgi:hypothetical protein
MGRAPASPRPRSSGCFPETGSCFPKGGCGSAGYRPSSSRKAPHEVAKAPDVLQTFTPVQPPADPWEKRRRVPLGDIPGLIRQHDEGARLVDLAEEYGVSHQAMSKLLRKHREGE